MELFKRHKKEKKTLETIIFQNILRLPDVLPNFPSRQVKRSAIISNKQGISQLPHEFRTIKDLGF